MTWPIAIVLAFAAIGFLWNVRANESARVASAILDGICPSCGKQRLDDSNILSLWKRKWIPLIECRDCRGRWRLPNRVRNEAREVVRRRAETRGVLVSLGDRRKKGCSTPSRSRLNR